MSVRLLTRYGLTRTVGVGPPPAAGLWTDFSEYTLDTEPHDWTQTIRSGTWQVESGPFLRGQGGSSGERYALVWDEIGDGAETEDIELLVKTRASAHTTFRGCGVIMMNPDNGNSVHVHRLQRDHRAAPPPERLRGCSHGQ